MDQERDAAPAEGTDIDIRRSRHQREEAPLPLEDRRRAGEAFPRQHRREDGVARSFGVGDALPVGQGLRARLAERNVIVHGEIDGLLQTVGGKLHQLAGGERNSGQAQDRNVPAPRGDVDVEGVDQPAIDLVGKGDRGDELFRARALGLRDRETGRDVVARMPGDAADIGVIEVEIADRRAVGEGRELERAAPPRADDGRAATAVRQRDVAANPHRLVVEGREGAAERVDDVHLDAFNGRVIEVLVAQPVGIAGEACCER